MIRNFEIENLFVTTLVNYKHLKLSDLNERSVTFYTFKGSRIILIHKNIDFTQVFAILNKSSKEKHF